MESGVALAQQIEPVLDAMQSGVSRDYKLKESFIQLQKEALEEARLSFIKMDEIMIEIEKEI